MNAPQLSATDLYSLFVSVFDAALDVGHEDALLDYKAYHKATMEKFCPAWEPARSRKEELHISGAWPLLDDKQLAEGGVQVCVRMNICV